MQKSIKINLFYTNFDKEAEVKYNSILEQITKILDSEENKGKYLGLTIEQEGKE